MKCRIMIVDDFENTRWVIQNTLKRFNCEFLTASNGKEALNYLDGRAIDLVITDLNMPEMDGIELVKYIRSHHPYEFIPVIILTTERNPDRKAQAAENKVTAWVQKPFVQEEFLKIVSKCISQQIK